MKASRWILLLALCVAVLALPACSDGAGVAPDGGTGTDIDTDTDTDTDADTDTDTDSDTDTPCVVYVIGAGGSDDASGSSWEEGLATVEAGLDLAEAHGCDVWVKAGTYFPNEDTDGSSTPTDPRAVTFRLRAGVALYGGFAGDELELSERDVVANETILSGELGIVGDSSDNSYHVVIGADFASIDGFTIARGHGVGDYPNSNGGGMYNDSASPTVTNCTFWDNSGGEYGGGMYNDSASPTVTGCTFSDNSADSGGGMANLDDSSPTVTSCTFSGNGYASGGGMFNDGSSPTVTGSTFSDNYAGAYGGGMFNFNGSSPTVTGCTFSGNSADRGGGMHNNESSPTVTSCTFSGNSTGAFGDGGGMYNALSSATVTGCTFSGNETYGYGGGMYNSSSSPTVTNCTFSGNSAGEFVEESEGLGGGMYNNESSPTVTNCILWGDMNEAGVSEIYDVGSSPAVTYSDVQGGFEGDGNIDADPLFVSTADLHLQSTSPCIDTGSNVAVPTDVTTDLDGNPRIVDGNDDATATVDMGAYEFQP